jgi:hypothetical protein
MNARNLHRALSIASAVLTLSCADLPVAPKAPKAVIHMEGVIRDRNGGAVSGARVIFRIPKPHIGGIVLDPRADPDRKEGLTGSDGSYAVDVPENVYSVGIYPRYESGYAPALVDEVIASKGSRRFDFTFPWLRLATRPLLQGGEPIAGVSVTIFPWNLFGYPEDYAFYVFPQVRGNELEMFLPPGWLYTVTTSAAGDTYAYMPKRQRITLDTDSLLEVSLGGNVIDAHVVGQNAAPMPGATIYALGPEGNTHATTDVAGAARFYLPSAGYVVDVGAPTENISWRRFPYVSVTSSASLLFDLSGTRWTGKVVRQGTGEALPDFEVHAQAIGGFGYAHQVTDASGTFDLIVRSEWGHDLYVTQGTSYYAILRNVVAGADSTFDIAVDQPILLEARGSFSRVSYLRPARLKMISETLRDGVIRSQVP